MVDEKRTSVRYGIDSDIFDRAIASTDTVARFDGIRYIKCDACGQIGTEDNFCWYGGAGHVNLGRCYDCVHNGREIHG